jgi:hypothetical protein
MPLPRRVGFHWAHDRRGRRRRRRRRGALTKLQAACWCVRGVVAVAREVLQGGAVWLKHDAARKKKK